MGCSIKFVRLDDFIADIDSLDLSTNGYALMNDGYFQVSAPIGAKSVHEVITLKLQGSSKDDLAAMTQEIDEKIKQVQWWMDDPGVERYQVWIRVQLDGETYARQAQILNIQPPDKVKVFTPMEINANYIGEYQIGIERTPFWEAPYPYPTTTAIDPVRTLGNIIGTFAETINGDVPARLAKFTFTADAGPFPVSSAWFGIKSSRFGNQANFVAEWFLINASSFGTDTTAGGSTITCTFATVPTLANRVIITVGDVAGANPSDQRGIYSVLLYARMSDSSVARVRMAYGYGSGGLAYSPIYRSRQSVSGTNWLAYEMGTISIPPTIISANDSLDEVSIGIEAELISGSGSLEMFCLTLIPIEAMIKVSMPSNQLQFATSPVSVYQKADGRIVAHHTVAGNINVILQTQQVNWGLPANSDQPIIVYCGQYDAANTVPGGQGEVTYTYIPRWRTLRGSAT